MKLGRSEVSGAWGWRRPQGEEVPGENQGRGKSPWDRMDHEHVAMRAGLIEQKQSWQGQLWQVT